MAMHDSRVAWKRRLLAAVGAMVLLSLVPPLFFAVMDPVVDGWRASQQAAHA